MTTAQPMSEERRMVLLLKIKIEGIMGIY